MALLNLSDRFNQIHLMLTCIMLVCFGLHLKKELTKFFEAKTTTAIKMENTPNLKMPAITICAEQVFDFTAPGNFKSYFFSHSNLIPFFTFATLKYNILLSLEKRINWFIAKPQVLQLSLIIESPFNGSIYYLWCRCEISYSSR